MAVWQCRLLLALVLLHLTLSSPVVRRDVLALTEESAPNPLAELQPESLGDDTFGQNIYRRGGREKRLLKTVGLGTLAVKGAKAVGTKVVATGAKVLGSSALKAGTKVLKVGAAVKAAAGGAIAVKAKAIGVKTVTTVAALGLKALIVKLLFGKINQFITQKEKLLNQLDSYNKVQNEKFSAQLFGAPCKHRPQSGYPGAGAGAAPTVGPAYNAGPVSLGEGGFSPDPLPQLTKSSLLPRRQAETTPAPTDDDEVPEFDPNKISLQVPDELFAPAFNSVNTISTVVGDLIQNTAERFARLVERLKPSFRKSWGFRSKKRQTDKENDVPEGDTELEIQGEPTFFTDSEPAAAQHAPAERQISPPPASTSLSTQEPATTPAERDLRGSLKTSYTALVDNS